MQFLKKHYEKIVLGVVLAGLIGVLVLMLFYIASDKEEMEKHVNDLINPPVKELAALDLSTNNQAMSRLKAPYVLDFDTGNKIFNPFEWQKTANGQMVKKAASVAQVVSVASIAPLDLMLSLDSVTTNEFGARYLVVVERQAAATAAKRQKVRRYVSVGDHPNDIFELVQVKGPADNPDALVLKLNDSGDTITVGRDKPYRHVEGYSAELRYDMGKKISRAHRVGDKDTFGGTEYVISGIDKNEVILTDQSNQKKTSLPFAP